MPLHRGTDWRLVLILLAAGLVGFASIIPLVMELLPRLIGPEEEAKLREFPPADPRYFPSWDGAERFGLGELTPWLVVRVLVLNGIAGLVYGWLYTRRGLEAAVVAHAATHVPLQVLAGTAASVARSVG